MSNKLHITNIQSITKQYYSGFCGTDISVLNPGTYFVCSSERDAELKGFGKKYTLFALVNNDLCVISYSPKHSELIASLRNLDRESIIDSLIQHFELKTMQLMIFDREIIDRYGDARILTEQDYSLYEEFFKETKPYADPSGWLYDYFAGETSKGFFTGYVKNGKLVSVCDTPEMPYMEGRIQHTGIETIITERRKGYAKYTAALATHNLIKNSVCPQWECSIDNIASIKLAESIGYEKYAVAYIVRE